MVSKCQVTFGMVSDPAAALEVCFGKQGVLSAEPDGPRAYVDCSTINEEASKKINEAVTAKVRPLSLVHRVTFECFGRAPLFTFRTGGLLR